MRKPIDHPWILSGYESTFDGPRGYEGLHRKTLSEIDREKGASNEEFKPKGGRLFNKRSLERW